MEGRGRSRPEYNKPLRKPGEVSAEQEEKPAVLTQDKANIESGNVNNDKTDYSNYVQSLMISDKKDETSKEKSLEDVVDAKEFVPSNVNKNIPVVNAKDCDSGIKVKEFFPSVNAKEFVPQTISSSKSTPISVFAKEFVPGKPNIKELNTLENTEKIRKFVESKLYQVQQDPGCTEEISSCMLNYLSLSIKHEGDVDVVASLLLEKCLSDFNFQYCGATIANFLDKTLVIPGLNTQFRSLFLNRCKVASQKIKDLIAQNDLKVQNYAIFFGELLMTYKMKNDEPIEKFLSAVVDILDMLLASKNPKFHITAGKLMKLTGSNLGEHQSRLFTTISNMSLDPSIDRTAQLIFSNLLQSGESKQRQDDKPPPVTSSPYVADSTSSPYMANSTSSDDMSLYVPSTDLYLEEQVELPVCGEDEWNQFVDENEVNQEWLNMYYEQYGYIPYATAEDDPKSDDPFYLDDYDAELEDFTSKQQ